MRISVLLLSCVLAGCGGSAISPSPTPSPSPSPSPAPAPAPTQTHITGTLTDTMTGASVGSFTADTLSFPAHVSVSAPGYLPRETWVRSSTPTVDLISNAAPFDLGFYRQLVRNGYESPGALQPVAVLSASPSVYLQTAGLSTSNVAALEAAARAVVPALSGGVLNVAAWETGPDVRSPSNGWIVVDVITDAAASCGRSQIGTAAGHVWLNAITRCQFGGYAVYPPSFAHELGHALGFTHVGQAGSLMKSDGPYSVSQPSAAERYHAAIAYHRLSGNMDVDSDSLTSSPARTLRVVD